MVREAGGRTTTNVSSQQVKVKPDRGKLCTRLRKVPPSHQRILLNSSIRTNKNGNPSNSTVATSSKVEEEAKTDERMITGTRNQTPTQDHKTGKARNHIAIKMISTDLKLDRAMTAITRDSEVEETKGLEAVVEVGTAITFSVMLLTKTVNTLLKTL